MKVNERAVVLVIAAVQFINIVDFMMVTPLGPFFARGLSIEESDLGLVVASYTGAAGVAGLLGSLFLDRFDRRTALGVALCGLLLATALGGLAQGLPSLLVTRALAGMFGGPATALSMAIIADVIPVERRGRALGTVSTAFSAAAVLGVPGGLQLAELGGWRMPFFAVAGLGLLIVAGGLYFLPPLRGHLSAAAPPGSALRELRALSSNRLVLLSWSMTAVVMMAGFILIPNMPAYLTGNLGVPLQHIKFLYLVGGLTSIVTFRVAGKLVDAFGSFRVGSAASLLLGAQLFFYVVWFVPGTPVALMFVTFMLLLNLRNVAYNTLTSRVPEPRVRARFQSIQSAVQHGASALAGALSAWILARAPGGGLRHVEWIGAIAIALALLTPVLLRLVERGVGGRPPPVASR